MEDFLKFRTFVTPKIIQVIFLLAVAVCVLSSFAYIANERILQGLLLMVFGPLLARVYCELVIIVFSIHDRLKGIEDNTA